MARFRAGKRAIRAHSQAMEYILSKIVEFLIAICVASTIALTLGYVAHYVFGLSRLDVRTSALMGAAILALIFALLVATEWFEKAAKIQMTRVLLVGVVFMFSGGGSAAPTKDKPRPFGGSVQEASRKSC